MAKQAARTELSSSEFNDETSSSSDDQQERPSNVSNKKDSIKNYVTNVLHRHGRDDEQPTDLTQTQIKIDTRAGIPRSYENVSAFRQYQSNTEGMTRTDAQQRQGEDSTSDEDDNLRNQSSAEQVNKIISFSYFLKKSELIFFLFD